MASSSSPPLQLTSGSERLRHNHGKDLKKSCCEKSGHQKPPLQKSQQRSPPWSRKQHRLPKPAAPAREPILTTRNLVKRYGRVTALDHANFDLYPGEVLAVIGDNGAGKTSLIKAICGAVTPDEGEITLEGKPIHFKSPLDARNAGIETVYQNLALSPALSISDNMFMGREIRAKGFLGDWFKLLDRKAMEKIARDKLTELGLMTIQNISQPVETLSGGQRQGVAVARAAAFGSKVVIMDEPTAALGVKESRRVLELIQDVRKRGLPIVLISHNMPHVFEVATASTSIASANASARSIRRIGRCRMPWP